MYYSNHYVIVWDKVKTLEDVKRLLKAAQITFEPNNQYLDSIKDIVKLENKTITSVSL